MRHLPCHVAIARCHSAYVPSVVSILDVAPVLLIRKYGPAINVTVMIPLSCFHNDVLQPLELYLFLAHTIPCGEG